MGEKLAKDTSDPPDWPGWEHDRNWRRALLRWASTSDLPVGRRADRVLKRFDRKLQNQMENLTHEVLQGEDGVRAIIKVLDQLSGEREGDDV